MDVDTLCPSSEAPLLSHILESITREKEPLIIFLSGDRLEDLFADCPQDTVCPLSLNRGARKCERLRYLINIYIQTRDFFLEYPECDTRKENWEFWDDISNPGYHRHGKMKSFAEKHGYPISRLRKALNRGGKIRAIESELDEPLVPLLLLPIFHMLDQLSYHGARQLGLLLSRDCPDLLSVGQSILKRWKVYVETYDMLLDG
jgi:hypothetical protein